jgi:hypothetical protein
VLPAAGLGGQTWLDAAKQNAAVKTVIKADLRTSLLRNMNAFQGDF